MTVKVIPFENKYAIKTRKLIINILENEFNFLKIKRPDLWQIAKTYQTAKGNFWLALDTSDVVGTIALQDCGDGRGYLRRMYVRKEYRSKGLGSKLLSVVLNFAKNNHYKKIYLATTDAMTQANKFYCKNGFKKIKRLPNDIPAPGDSIFYEILI
ncbi:MAG: GNAT family N-acetyltransferase [Patescibacteria group bacterium]